MSFDLRLSVKVEGADLYAVIAEPEYANPTYNIGDMFRACTGWDFVQGEWYKVSEVYDKICHGISELEKNEERYKKYNAKNGWGDTRSALAALKSLKECIDDMSIQSWTRWNVIPKEYMYVAW